MSVANTLPWRLGVPAPNTSQERPNIKARPKRSETSHNKLYDALVFSSGGTRGIAHFGALAELERSYDFSDIRFYVGTSAGAIAAAVACLGLSAKDVFHACVLPFVYEKDFRIGLLTKEFGLDRGASLERFIASIIPHSVTFRDVYKDTGNVLSVIGTNLTTSSMEIFDPLRTPDMTLRDALRISCSIPFLFTAVTRDNQVYVDGALTSSFPVSVAVDIYGCTRVLGLDFEEYVSTIEKDWNFEQFLSTVVDTVIYSNSKTSYRGVDVCTIEIPGEVNGLAFDLSISKKRDMYDAGTVSMRIFLKKKL